MLKGPILNSANMPTATHVESQALSYGSFEGTIPAEPYGQGKVGHRIPPDSR
jgi:hypothetical protein